MNTDKELKCRTINILVLEDSARDFELIKEKLIDAGYALNIEHVETESTFATSLRDKVWDIILADFRLYGFDAFGALRIKNAICSDTPFICVSGSIGEGAAIELLKSGAQDYVMKDHLDRLPLAIGRAMGEAWERKMRRQNEEALMEANRQLKISQAATLSILEDLKVEVRARQAKEAELQKVTMAIEQAGEIVIITTKEGNIQYVNPAFTIVTGYSKDEVLGKNPRFLKSGKQDSEFYLDLWTTISTGKIWKGRMTNRRKDGEFYHEESTISPVLDETGQILNYVAVKRDITDLLRAEEDRKKIEAQFQQAQKLESIGRLAGGVAHDFNNILSVILGYGEIILKEMHREDPLWEDVQEMVTAGHRAKSLTRQLLAFSRKQTLQPEALDLNSLIRDLEKMLYRLIGEDIELKISLTPDIFRVFVDPGQIEQVILNLVVNARDAMPKGGKLLIETTNVELDEVYSLQHSGVQPGKYVLLAVTDTGCGMSKEILDRIFEPFFTTKAKDKGTGLGLSTVYGIVKQSGGNIWVYSEPGQGTTFKIYLPRTHILEELPSVRFEETSMSTAGKHILVVEDDESLRKLIQNLLSQLQYTVTLAANGGEALSLIEETGLKPDMIITDVVMPNMSGKELIERLKLIYPDLKSLYMSGYTDNAIVHHGVLDPGTPFIQKPFSIHDLDKKVKEVLQKEIMPQ